MLISQIGEDASPQLNGLLMRRLPNGTTQWYVGVERAVELWDDSRDILLQNLACKDSGTYKCLLSAPVGEQNQEGQVHLTVTGTDPRHFCVSISLELLLSFC